MNVAAVIFALAAIGGLTVAGMRLSGVPRPPTWLALAHGAVAAAGLISLIYAATSQTLPFLAQLSLGGFVLAALGGATIFTMFHLREKPLPIPLIIAHGSLAVASYVLLLLALFQ
jgi:hypothetical protein